MAKDTFKRTAPVIEFFKDGETVRAKKLGKILEDIQDGMASLEAAIGDLHNIAYAFESPLFQNSMARSIGQVNEISLSPNKEFSIIEKTKTSLHQGLVKWPYSWPAASSAGNKSLNLIPYIDQNDKVGLGCTRDDGHRCIAGYDTFYDKEKNLVPNGFFQLDLAASGWTPSYATLRSPNGISLSPGYRYNFLDYSENLENWTIVGPGLTVARDQLPDPNGQSATYKISESTSTESQLLIKRTGSGATTSSDWCFHISLAASGNRLAYLAFSGITPTSVSGSLEGGSFEYDGTTYYGIRVSGNSWNRYWIHATLGSPVAASAVTPMVVLNINGLSDPTPLYVFGGQLEPTNFPTEYRRTEGAVTSGFESEIKVSYDLDTIPGHIYQVTLEGSGSVQARVDESPLFTLTYPSTYGLFQATSTSHTIEAYVSGSVASTNYVDLFRIDPGTPCHAMNCPGFSAYNSIRQYRAVLPKLTISGHQYFASQLQLPDEFQQALYDELPGNILGIYDHELNHAVPKSIVNWKLANWPIGGNVYDGLVNDPEFLGSWATSGTNEYPTEFAITDGSPGAFYQDTDPLMVTSLVVVPKDSAPYLGFDGTNDEVVGSQLIRINETFTTEMFLKMPSGLSMVDHKIALSFGYGPETTDKSMFTIFVSLSGHVCGRIHSTGDGTCQAGYANSSTQQRGTINILDNEWHHIAVQTTKYTSGPIGSQMWIYVDGAFDSSGIQNTATVFDWSDPAGYYMRLGNSITSNPNSYYSGLMRGVLSRRGTIYGSGNISFTAPPALIPSGNIIFYWPFTDHQDTILSDHGPSGYIGTLAGPVWYSGGPKIALKYPASPGLTGEQARAFYTSGTYPPYTYGVDQTFTIEGWFRSDSGLVSRPIIGRYSTYNINYMPYINIDGGLAFQLGDETWASHPTRLISGFMDLGGTANPGYWEHNSTSITDSNWHHWAVEIQKNSSEFVGYLYQDGIFLMSGISSGLSSWQLDREGVDSNWSLRIGENPASPYSRNTYIGEILITSGRKYNPGGGTSNFTPYWPLSTSGEKALYHWRMTEGSGDILYDHGPYLSGSNLVIANESSKVGSAQWYSESDTIVYSYSTTPADRLVISGTSNISTIEKTFALDKGSIYTFIYEIKGETEPSGVVETYNVILGSGEIDLYLDNDWEVIPAEGLENYYQLSGSIAPGNTLWSSQNSLTWTIKRKLKATSDNALITVGVGVSGLELVTIDSINLQPVSTNSTIFEYCNDTVLGFNWEGRVSHVTEENLLPWSERPDYWNYNTNVSFEFNIINPSGLPNAIRVLGTSVGYDFDVSNFTDPTLTLQFWARSNNPANANSDASIYWTQDAYDVQTFTLDGNWRQITSIWSGVDLRSATTVSFEIAASDPGFEIEIADVVLHHGSGIVEYEKTEGNPIKRYRYALRIDEENQIQDYWDHLYGLINTSPIQTQLTQDSDDGTVFEVDPNFLDIDNFPTSGVIQIAGQEFSYRYKNIATTSGFLGNCTQSWRGTTFDPSVLTSGKRVTYVQLPWPIDRIENDLIIFKELLPVSYGDWANNLNIKLYNSQISNLDRFSVMASAVPLSRTVGSLMTAFMNHVSNDAQHFRRDQLCAMLVDPSIYAGFEDMEVRLTVPKNYVEEVYEEGIINVFAYGFMAPNDKLVRVSWGDGQVTLVSGTGQYFEAIPHIYDLGASTRSRYHTILVEVLDQDLKVSRQNTKQILVTPISKGSQKVRSVIIVQEEAIQQARTAIWASVSGIQTARTYINIT